MIKRLLEARSEKLEGVKVYFSEDEFVTIEPIEVQYSQFANRYRLPQGFDMVISDTFERSVYKRPKGKPTFFYLTKLAREMIWTGEYLRPEFVAFVSALLSPGARIESETVKRAVEIVDDATNHEIIIRSLIDSVEAMYGEVGVDMYARGCRNEVPRLFVLGEPFYWWPNQFLPKDLRKRLKKWCNANGFDFDHINVNIDTVNKCVDFDNNKWLTVINAKHIPPKASWLILEGHDPVDLLAFYNKKKGRFKSKKEFHKAVKK